MLKTYQDIHRLTFFTPHRQCSIQTKCIIASIMRDDMPSLPIEEAYRWCNHLANASETAPATASLPFRPFPVAFGHADR